MSTIILSAFATFRRRGDELEHVSGISASRLRDDGRYELTLKSVPFIEPRFSGRAPAVGEGMLMMYGRDRMEEMQRQRAKARATGAELACAEFEFEVGSIETNLIDRNNINGQRFANVRRMKAELQTQLLYRFAGYVDAEGGNSDLTMARVVQIATRPELYARAFKDDKDLAGLDMLVVPVADGEDHAIRQLAYVRPKARLVSVCQGGEVDLVLPEWMNLPALEEMH